VAVSDAVYIDLDEAGDAVGFEILNATSADLEDIPSLPGTAPLRDLLTRQAS